MRFLRFLQRLIFVQTLKSASTIILLKYHGGSRGWGCDGVASHLRCSFFEIASVSISHRSDPTCNPHSVYKCMCCHASLNFTSGCLRKWERFLPVRSACSRTAWCALNTNTLYLYLCFHNGKLGGGVLLFPLIETCVCVF